MVHYMAHYMVHDMVHCIVHYMVLFSVQVTATYYSVAHLWKAMFTAVCGALVFRVSREMGSLALFNLTHFSDMGELLYNGKNKCIYTKCTCCSATVRISVSILSVPTAATARLSVTLLSVPTALQR